MNSIEIIGADAIEVDFKDKPAQVQKALARALNRGIRSARTVMTREMARDTGLKQKDIREMLTMRDHASASHPEVDLSARFRPIRLMNFGAKGPVPSRGRGKGVSYRLPGGRNRDENAFIATVGGTTHKGVFKRQGKSRYPLIQLHGPTPAKVFSKFRAMALQRAYEVFEKEFDHELAFATSGAGGDATD